MVSHWHFLPHGTEIFPTASMGANSRYVRCEAMLPLPHVLILVTKPYCSCISIVDENYALMHPNAVSILRKNAVLTKLFSHSFCQSIQEMPVLGATSHLTVSNPIGSSLIKNMNTAFI